MKKLCLLFIAFGLLLSSFSSCNNEAGEGGTGTVQGYVKLVHHPDDNYQLDVDTIVAAKTDVFIVYGNEEFNGDDVETDSKGFYRFEYLTPGEYTVYSYSTLPSGERVPVAETVTLQRGGVSQVPTLYIHDGKAYGTSIITGKIWGMYFHNESYRGEGWAYEHRVYLRKLGETYHQDDVRVGLDGSFAFQKVHPGTYEVFTFTQNVDEVPLPLIDTLTIEADQIYTMQPDTTFIVRIQV